MGFQNTTLDAYSSNLVGGWAMDSPTTIEMDRSDNGRNGVIYGVPTQLEAGKNNYAITFAEDGLIDCGSVGVMSGRFTFGYWFKTADTSGINWIACIGGFENGIGIAIDTTSGANRIFVYAGLDFFSDPESRAFSDVVTIDDDTWHLVTVSRMSNSTFSMYLDGLNITPQYNSAYAVDLTGKSLRFATNRDNNNLSPTFQAMLNATLDESWLWNTELSYDANVALWNAGSGRFLTQYKKNYINSNRIIYTWKNQKVDF